MDADIRSRTRRCLVMENLCGIKDDAIIGVVDFRAIFQAGYALATRMIDQFHGIVVMEGTSAESRFLGPAANK